MKEDVILARSGFDLKPLEDNWFFFNGPVVVFTIPSADLISIAQNQGQSYLPLALVYALRDANNSTFSVSLGVKNGSLEVVWFMNNRQNTKILPYLSEKNVVIRIDQLNTLIPLIYINSNFIGTGTMTAPLVKLSALHTWVLSRDRVLFPLVAFFNHNERDRAQRYAEQSRNAGITGDFLRLEQSIDPSTSSPIVNSSIVDPADARFVKDSADAWATAIRNLRNPTALLNYQRVHDRLMNEWMIQRGGSIAQDSYDYNVHSAWIAWAKAIETTTSATELATIRAERTRVLSQTPNYQTTIKFKY